MQDRKIVIVRNIESIVYSITLRETPNELRIDAAEGMRVYREAAMRRRICPTNNYFYTDV